MVKFFFFLSLISFAISDAGAANVTGAFGQICLAGNTCTMSGARENAPTSILCAAGSTINVTSASYGANGKTTTCAPYLQKLCNSKNSCQITFSNTNCGSDPIYGVVKTGTAVVGCSALAQQPPLAITSSAAAVSPSSLQSNGTVRFSVNLTSNGTAAGINVSLEVRDPAGASQFFQKVYASQAFNSGQTRSYFMDYVVPSTMAAGTYCMIASAFDSTWTKVYLWNSCAAQFTVVSATNPPVAGKMALPGTNLSGGEYNLGKAGARLWFDYVYPSNAELDYFAAKGMKIIRIPFDLGRIQTLRLGPLNTSELSRIDAVIQYANSKGLKVLLDPHNFGTMTDNSGVVRDIVKDPLMPASYFADFWKKMAMYYAANQNVIFGLMNEPNSQTALQWKEAAVAAVNAIRATGSKHQIFIPGTAWSGAHSWVASGNAAAWAGFQDINFAFEVHQYLDTWSSGTENTCVVGNGAKVLSSFTTWARANKVRGFLGEIGWTAGADCMTEGANLMAYMSSNVDVWLGYTYWAAGPWLGEYVFTLEPKGLGTATVTDRPQMSILLKQQ